MAMSDSPVKSGWCVHCFDARAYSKKALRFVPYSKGLKVPDTKDHGWMGAGNGKLAEKATGL
jgi:hypothetical protein